MIKDDEEVHLLPPTTSSKYSVRSEFQLDTYVAERRRNWLLLGNATLCLILYVISMELIWNGSKEIHSQSSNALRLIIVALTLVNTVQSIEYHSLRASKRLAVIGRTIRRRRRVRVRVRDRCSEFFAPRFLYLLVIEILVVLPTPVPYVVASWSGWIGLIIWLRVFMYAIRVFRDNAWISNAQDRQLHTAQRRLRKNRSSFLAIKALFYSHPVLCLLGQVFAGCWVFGYSFYVVERTAQPDLFTFGPSLYLATQILVTGWASDSFDEVDPELNLSKAIALICVVYGLLVFALLLELVHELFKPSKLEERTVLAVERMRMQKIKEEAAARVIQSWWRWETGPDDEEVEAFALKRLIAARTDFSMALGAEDKFVVDHDLEENLPAEHDKQLDQLMMQMDQISTHFSSLQTSIRALKKKMKKKKRQKKSASIQ